MVDRGDPTVVVFRPEDGPRLKAEGEPHHKKPVTVYLYQPQPHPDVKPGTPAAREFSVLTNEGWTTAPFGDYVAYDEHFQHVWPVSADYVDVHYAEGEATELPTVPATVAEQGEFGARLVAEPGYTFETRLDETGLTPELIIEVVPAGSSNGYVGRHRQEG